MNIVASCSSWQSVYQSQDLYSAPFEFGLGIQRPRRTWVNGILQYNDSGEVNEIASMLERS